MQALLGSVAAAAYNLTFQLGFATTQICESVAVAVQTLLAREIAGGMGSDKKEDATKATLRAKRVRHLINGSIVVGGFVAGGLSLLTYFQKDSVLLGLMTDTGVRESSRVIFPMVLVKQGAFQLLFLAHCGMKCHDSHLIIDNLLTLYFAS